MHKLLFPPTTLFLAPDDANASGGESIQSPDSGLVLCCARKIRRKNERRGIKKSALSLILVVVALPLIGDHAMPASLLPLV